MFNKPFQNVKYGRQRKLNYTSISSAFSLAKKYNLLLKRLNCGHVTSRSRSGNNHVVWLNCKISFIGLVLTHINKNVFKGTAKTN